MKYVPSFKISVKLPFITGATKYPGDAQLSGQLILLYIILATAFSSLHI